MWCVVMVCGYVVCGEGMWYVVRVCGVWWGYVVCGGKKINLPVFSRTRSQVALVGLFVVFAPDSGALRREMC